MIYFFIDFLIFFAHIKISLQARVLLMLQEKLPECTNKQRCDEFCTSFCYLNSKGARKKLVQALIKLPRSRLDLTPTYARYSLLIFIDSCIFDFDCLCCVSFSCLVVLLLFLLCLLFSEKHTTSFSRTHTRILTHAVSLSLSLFRRPSTHSLTHTHSPLQPIPSPTHTES